MIGQVCTTGALQARTQHQMSHEHATVTVEHAVEVEVAFLHHTHHEVETTTKLGGVLGAVRRALLWQLQLSGTMLARPRQ